jgi:hypothetical protein
MIKLPLTIMEGVLIPAIGNNVIDYIFKLITLLALVYGSFKAARSINECLFLIVSLIPACITVIAIPKWRNMMSLIPITVLSASRYGEKIACFLCKYFGRTGGII